MLLAQLQKYFGKEVEDYLDYFEIVWAREPFTYAPYTQQVLPHQYNGHEIYREPILGGKLFIAGSETASAFPGYMEGAVESALRAKSYLITQFQESGPGDGVR